ncbi:hypothetical protein M0805_009788 [Coniferiporia weirii]|nr:hypothetical protein M0805_009788 [Coniferiporia weirii]
MKLSTFIPVHLLLLIISLVDDINAGDDRARPIPTSALLIDAQLPYSNQYRGTGGNSSFVRRADEGGQEVDDVICHPAGACEPCPEDLLGEPFCQPFGNRRLLHCRSVSSSPIHDPPPPDRPKGGHNQEANSPGAPSSHSPHSALPAWESCGRRVPKERADFFEFVLCNVIFAALALLGALIRTERMRVVRARRLAARIGVGLRRASSGSWAAMGGMGAALTAPGGAGGEGLSRQDATG